MLRRRAFLLVLALCALLFGFRGGELGAQASPPRIELRLPTLTTPPLVAVRDVLAESSFDQLLRNGFPTRLHFRTELWTTGRWFDDVVARSEWDLIIRYDVLDRTYEVVRIRNATNYTTLGTFSRFEDARAASEAAFAPPMTAPSRGRKSYYVVQVDVQTLEMTDLDEVQRWLRGEAAPAIQGRRNPGAALTRGFRTLLSRILGAETRHLELRSPVFTL